MHTYLDTYVKLVPSLQVGSCIAWKQRQHCQQSPASNRNLQSHSTPSRQVLKKKVKKALCSIQSGNQKICRASSSCGPQWPVVKRHQIVLCSHGGRHGTMGETLDRITSICHTHDLKPLALEVKKKSIHIKEVENPMQPMYICMNKKMKWGKKIRNLSY